MHTVTTASNSAAPSTQTAWSYKNFIFIYFGEKRPCLLIEASVILTLNEHLGPFEAFPLHCHTEILLRSRDKGRWWGAVVRESAVLLAFLLEFAGSSHLSATARGGLFRWASARQLSRASPPCAWETPCPQLEIQLQQYLALATSPPPSVCLLIWKRVLRYLTQITLCFRVCPPKHSVCKTPFH